MKGQSRCFLCRVFNQHFVLGTPVSLFNWGMATNPCLSAKARRQRILSHFSATYLKMQ